MTNQELDIIKSIYLIFGFISAIIYVLKYDFNSFDFKVKNLIVCFILILMGTWPLFCIIWYFSMLKFMKILGMVNEANNIKHVFNIKITNGKE